jgi:hypothetical protein
LSASCGSAAFGEPSRLSFCSHWSPVTWSVTVPTPLSTKRSVVVVVLELVVVVVVGVWMPARHTVP